MNEIFQYLLKWSIALGVVFLFYRIALRPLTFYQWNRRYLIMYSMVAFLIPFINLTTYVEPQQLKGIALVQYIPTLSLQSKVIAAGTEQGRLSLWIIAGIFILVGSLFLLARLIIQWFSLHRIRRNAVRIYHPEATVYHVDENVIPFSFGNAIYVNTTLHTETELNDIILHEFVHVRQKHSFDIIWSEVLCILNWYNPFAWFIRHAIRQNLEFIADQSVLQHGLDRKTYQYHLLKVIGSPQYSIANNFNFSSLKKRIAMMNRLKSARVHLVKFVFVLPLLAILLVAFRNNEGWYHEINTDTIKKPVPPDEPVEIRLVTLKDFYKLHPSVKEVAISAEEELVIYLRDGARESYRMQNNADMNTFKAKYEAIPILSQKGPLFINKKAVGDGVMILDDKAVGDYVMIPDNERHIMAAYEDQLRQLRKNNPNIAEVISGPGALTLRLKDGTTEKYDLNDPDDINRFAKKYGCKPPMVPPPTPPKEPSFPTAPSLPTGVTSLEVEDGIATLRLKNGKTESYDLNMPSEKIKFERKYGPVLKLEEVPADVGVAELAEVSVHGDVKVHDADKISLDPLELKADVTQVNENTMLMNNVKVIMNDHTLEASNVVVHLNSKDKHNEKVQPVYYINGRKSAQQDPKQLPVISHAEIITDVQQIKLIGEKEGTAIINIITKENTLNKSVYLSKESVKIIEEQQKKEAEKRNN